MRLLLYAALATVGVQALVGTSLAQRNGVGRIPPPIDRDYGRQQTLVINMRDQVFVDRPGYDDDWGRGGIGRGDDGRGGGRMDCRDDRGNGRGGGYGNEFDNGVGRGTIGRDRTGGLDRGGLDRGGIDRDGRDLCGIDSGGIDRGGLNRGGLDRGGLDRGGGGIDRRGRVGHGGNEIRLKQLILQNYPTINVNDLELVDVKLIAKSARGEGLAELVVDGRVEDRNNVRIFLGRDARNEREAFEYGGPLTYDQVQLTPLRLSAQSSSWQIDLTGMIKVRAIEITVRNSGGRHEPGGPGRDPYDRVQNVRLGTMMPQRAYSDVRSFNVYEREVVEVRLEGFRGEAMVDSVEVQYRRGPSEMLYSLTGTIREREVKTARLRNGGDVSAIIIRAQGSRYVMANSEIDVSLGVLR